MQKTLIAFIGAFALLTGCQEQRPGSASKLGATAGNQYQLCETNSYQQALQSCKEGQLVSVLPNRWGNEQFPLVMASVVCDFDHTVVQTNGGVVCVFTKKRFDNLMAEQTKKDKDASQN